MNKTPWTTKPTPVHAIAVLLAGLAAGCFFDNTGDSGSCGEVVTDTYEIDAAQLAMLESGDNSACASMCEGLGTYVDAGCSWEPLGAATAGGTTGGVSSDSGADGSGEDTDSTEGTGTDATSTTTDATSTTTDATTTDATGTTTTQGGEPAAILSCNYQLLCVGGRGHAALEPAEPPSARDAMGQWLARMAHSEAASVVAFRAVADELEAHHAPQDLVLRARAAADDEVRHAELMTTLARRRGVEPPRPRFAPMELRNLEALARENAVEGCVRETWAALEAHCQARRACDPSVREAMVGIAHDEARHAQLSWDLDAWARTRLSPDAVARIDAARQGAVEELEQALLTPRHRILCDHAGLPEAASAGPLFQALRHALWS